MCFRGQIYWVDLDKYVAKEKTSVQKKLRPFIILQNDIGNKYSPTTFGSAITSQFNKAKLKTHVEVTSRETGLNKDSVILLEQIITIDKCDLGDYIGQVPRSKIFEIDRALIISGGIDIEQQQVTNIIDKDKINNLISLIKDTEEMLKAVENDYFKRVRNGLINELKTYCNQCGANYDNIIINNKIGIEKIEIDSFRLAR